MDQKHTPGMKAARAIVLHIWPMEDPNNCDNAEWIDQKTETLAPIIDQNTGLPELKAERDRLLAILKRLDAWARIGYPKAESMAEILKDARAELAPAPPESGEKDDGS